MALGDFLAHLGLRDTPEPAAAVAPTDRPPTADALREALEETERLVTGGAVPSPVTARVQRVTATVRDTIPRLEAFGAGSDRAYSVMATATDYLPEAVGGYLRLPRRFADTRPVDGPKTALMVLVDQLDLLGATMDAVFDAVCRDDANALVAHGRVLTAKFGARCRGGDLEVGGSIAVPPQPESVGSPSGEASPAAAQGLGASPESAGREAAGSTEEPAPSPAAPSSPAPAGASPATPPQQPGPEPGATDAPAAPAPDAEPAPDPDLARLRPPSSLDL